MFPSVKKQPVAAWIRVPAAVLLCLHSAAACPATAGLPDARTILNSRPTRPVPPQFQMAFQRVRWLDIACNQQYSLDACTAYGPAVRQFEAMTGMPYERAPSRFQMYVFGAEEFSRRVTGYREACASGNQAACSAYRSCQAWVGAELSPEARAAHQEWMRESQRRRGEEAQKSGRNPYQ